MKPATIKKTLDTRKVCVCARAVCNGDKQAVYYGRMVDETARFACNFLRSPDRKYSFLRVLSGCVLCGCSSDRFDKMESIGDSFMSYDIES